MSAGEKAGEEGELDQSRARRVQAVGYALGELAGEAHWGGGSIGTKT